MVECNKCKRCFRDNYRLTRHLSRLIPCDLKIKNINNLNLQINPPIQSFETKPQSLESANESLIKCEFCFNTFAKKYNLKIHSEICKYRNDPIRLLEIQNKVKAKEPASKYECRFCNNKFHNSSNLKKHFKSFKDRED